MSRLPEEGGRLNEYLYQEFEIQVHSVCWRRCRTLALFRQIIISVTLLSACLYVLIAQPTGDLRQWAAGMIGSIVTWWMPGHGGR